MSDFLQVQCNFTKKSDKTTEAAFTNPILASY